MSTAEPQISLFFFAAAGDGNEGDRYRLLIEAAKLGDENGFAAIWIPERHFQKFGGLYPSPSVAATAIAMVTKRIQVRAGSVVLPLQNPIRVAEEWAMIDNLSGGRVAISIASGWHMDDFVLSPSTYQNRHADLLEKVEILRRLWRGERIRLPNGKGDPVEVGILPRPLQAELPIWLTASSDDGFDHAAKLGFNVLTANFKQNEGGQNLKRRIDAYRDAMLKNHGKRGHVTLMTHTYCGTPEQIERYARPAMRAYIASNLEMKSTPGFRTIEDRKREVMIDFRTDANLSGELSFIGTRARCREQAAALGALGVDEITCLIDFGIPFDETMASLRELALELLSGQPRRFP